MCSQRSIRYQPKRVIDIRSKASAKISKCSGLVCVCCRYAGFIRCTGFKKEGGKVTEVHATFREPEEGEKPGKVGIFASITLHRRT